MGGTFLGVKFYRDMVFAQDAANPSIILIEGITIAGILKDYGDLYSPFTGGNQFVHHLAWRITSVFADFEDIHADINTVFGVADEVAQHGQILLVGEHHDLAGADGLGQGRVKFWWFRRGAYP